jgi:uncharacterized protein (TIGR00251 family)
MKIKVRVKARSSREEVVKSGDEYVVHVRAAPVEGKANEAVIRLLAQKFGVPRSSVKISSGLTGRTKIIEIRTD